MSFLYTCMSDRKSSFSSLDTVLYLFVYLCLGCRLKVCFTTKSAQAKLEVMREDQGGLAMY